MPRYVGWNQEHELGFLVMGKNINKEFVSGVIEKASVKVMNGDW